MNQITCSGLPAAWINGWLAAVGATVLDARIRLHWTTDGTPLAVLSASDPEPTDALVESWPDEKLLSDLPIAQDWNGAGKLQRKVSVEDFVERARAARNHRYSWALTSTMTDLYVDKNGEVAHAPFDPSGPGTIKWLHHRLTKVNRHVEQCSAARIQDSLLGRADRIKINGLGFDQTRIGSLADDAPPWVDPVVEVLAFFGLAILPVRGNGIDQRQDPSVDAAARQRGWRKISGNSERRFTWPAWRQPLDKDGIDALMDAWSPEKKPAWRRVGVHAAWRSVQFKRRERVDTTRAFGAEQL